MKGGTWWLSWKRNRRPGDRPPLQGATWTITGLACLHCKYRSKSEIKEGVDIKTLQGMRAPDMRFRICLSLWRA